MRSVSFHPSGDFLLAGNSFFLILILRIYDLMLKLSMLSETIWIPLAVVLILMSVASIIPVPISSLSCLSLIS